MNLTLPIIRWIYLQYAEDAFEKDLEEALLRSKLEVEATKVNKSKAWQLCDPRSSLQCFYFCLIVSMCHSIKPPPPQIKRNKQKTKKQNKTKQKLTTV